jgi:hypothetical protein
MLGLSLTIEFLHYKTRTQSDAQYENTEVDELISMLRDTEQLEEQGDILHYLVVSHGLEYCTGKSVLLIIHCSENQALWIS